MSHSSNRAGPHGQYQFRTELVGQPDGKPTRSRDGLSHRLIASRRYRSLRQLPSVGPIEPKLTALAERSINTTVERNGETIVPPGVTVTTIFEATPGSGYVPVDVLFDGVSLDQLPIDRGFWRLPDQLCACVERHSNRSITHRQLAYDGSETTGERERYSGHWPE